jgi:AP-3 complex subunit delta-1
VCALTYKVYVNSSENEHIIEEIVPYLSDRLKDSDPSVKMTAISTIYEITKIDQTLFVVTIPVVYQLLCEVNNNWVLIKIIKLLTEFCSVEPRLKIKLRPKFHDLLESQRAKSVQYEIIKASLSLYQ